MFCTECGYQLTHNEKFCPECGAKVIRAPKPESAGVGTGSNYSYVPPAHNAREVIHQAPKAPEPPKATVEHTPEPAVFCTGCGQKLGEGELFCTRCGTKAGGSAPASAAQAAAKTQTQPAEKKKMSGKKKAGIILIVLQVFAELGGIANGSIAEQLTIRGAADIFELLGNFLPLIIGVCLLIADKKKNG